MAAGALAVALGQVPLGRAAAQLALWGFLAPTFTIVSHRMLPFFTAGVLPFLDAWRPNWLLAAMLAALAVTGGGCDGWKPWAGAAGPALRGDTAGRAAPAACWCCGWPCAGACCTACVPACWPCCTWALSGWGVSLGWRRCRMPVCCGWAMQASLGLAPLHALTMGYLGATLIAMITRVAAGHSGRALAADNLAWGLYLLLQTGACCVWWRRFGRRWGWC
jgi:uncharacterized protein involved in response to NO